MPASSVSRPLSLEAHLPRSLKQRRASSETAIQYDGRRIASQIDGKILWRNLFASLADDKRLVKYIQRMLHEAWHYGLTPEHRKLLKVPGGADSSLGNAPAALVQANADRIIKEANLFHLMIPNSDVFNPPHKGIGLYVDADLALKYNHVDFYIGLQFNSSNVGGLVSPPDTADLRDRGIEANYPHQRRATSDKSIRQDRFGLSPKKGLTTKLKQASLRGVENTSKTAVMATVLALRRLQSFGFVSSKTVKRVSEAYVKLVLNLHSAEANILAKDRNSSKLGAGNLPLTINAAAYRELLSRQADELKGALKAWLVSAAAAGKPDLTSASITSSGLLEFTKLLLSKLRKSTMSYLMFLHELTHTLQINSFLAQANAQKFVQIAKSNKFVTLFGLDPLAERNILGSVPYENAPAEVSARETAIRLSVERIFTGSLEKRTALLAWAASAPSQQKTKQALADSLLALAMIFLPDRSVRAIRNGEYLSSVVDSAKNNKESRYLRSVMNLRQFPDVHEDIPFYEEAVEKVLKSGMLTTVAKRLVTIQKEPALRKLLLAAEDQIKRELALRDTKGRSWKAPAPAPAPSPIEPDPVAIPEELEAAPTPTKKPSKKKTSNTSKKAPAKKAATAAAKKTGKKPAAKKPAAKKPAAKKAAAKKKAKAS